MNRKSWHRKHSNDNNIMIAIVKEEGTWNPVLSSYQLEVGGELWYDADIGRQNDNSLRIYSADRADQSGPLSPLPTRTTTRPRPLILSGTILLLEDKGRLHM